jgi:hypothetical protein
MSTFCQQIEHICKKERKTWLQKCNYDQNQELKREKSGKSKPVGPAFAVRNCV